MSKISISVAWVTQLIEHPTLDFSSGHDLMVCKFEPRIGVRDDSTEPAWDSLSASSLLFLSLAQTK